MAPRKLQVLFTSITALVTWLAPDNDQGNQGTLFPDTSKTIFVSQKRVNLVLFIID